MQQEANSTMKSPVKGENESKELKTKILLSLPKDHPFSNLQVELKNRGIKLLDLNLLMKEVFSQVPDSWWKGKLDELTPLEYKVVEALKDSKMREKFKDLLL